LGTPTAISRTEFAHRCRCLRRPSES